MSSSAAATMSVSPISPNSPNSPTNDTHTKQLHPSETQLAAEAELGIDAALASSAVNAALGIPVTQALLAPKPTVIETRAGPVSPKVSPRLVSRNLSGSSSANRSPAYSANSSPRGSFSSRNPPINLAASTITADEFPGPTVDQQPIVNRRSSGNFSSGTMSNLVSLQPNPSLSNSSSSGSLLIPSPSLVRRASKPLTLSSGTNSGLQALLARHTIADIKVTRPVIELSSTATPQEGFELLLKNSILSCPVYDEAKKEYIGFLDVRDLVSSIVFANEEQKLTSSFHEQWNEMMLKGMQRFGSAVSVTYLSRRNPFRPIAQNATLLQVARALSTQLHRLPVVDSEGKCVRIISQSSLIQFLHAHREEIKTDLSQTISQINLGVCKVISVASDASAWQAFKVLEVNSVSGIAIVDRDGKLVGNTSARDLKLFVLNKGTLSLDAPIQDYLSRIRQRDYVDEVHPSCSISIGTTIAHCIGLLAATGYHRVFIVDSVGRPIGVVSVTDILRFAAAEPAGPAGSSTAGTPSPSNPTTPRGNNSKRSTGGIEVLTNSPASGGLAGSVVPPLLSPTAVTTPKSSHSPAGPAHLRSQSQTSTSIVTPPVRD